MVSRPLHLREWVDGFALPFWVLMLLYFWRKSQRMELTLDEKVLAAFAATGLLVDGVLTLLLIV